jgi:hypothetical protein
MSRPATSILAFGLYLVILGLLLVLTPNTFLGLFGFVSATEPWVHVLGVVVLVLGAYYVQAARQDLMPFFRMTIWGRLLVFVLFLLLALLRVAPPMLILFGAIDAGGAFWTAQAIARTRR